MKNTIKSATKTTALTRSIRRQRGANMVEYMVLVAVVALAGIAAFNKFSTSIDKTAEKQGQKVTELGGK